MSRVLRFHGANAHPGPLAIPAQMTERIQEAKRQGREVHVVAIVAEKQASGFYTYHPYWDAQPREVMSYMASELVLLAHDPPDDDPIPDLQA